MEQQARPQGKRHIALLHEKITGAILDAQREVQQLYLAHPHYSEANLREVMAIELRARSFDVKVEHAFKRLHRGQVIGISKADVLVNGQVIVEIKIADEFTDKMLEQMKTYLLDGQLAIGMLLRFSIRTGAGFERVFEPRYAPPRPATK